MVVFCWGISVPNIWIIGGGMAWGSILLFRSFLVFLIKEVSYILQVAPFAFFASTSDATVMFTLGVPIFGPDHCESLHVNPLATVLYMDGGCRSFHIRLPLVGERDFSQVRQREN
jgi:hypothetical protein